MVESFKAEMKKMFEMNDLGIMSYFLGLEVKQDKLGIHISQRKYIEDLLKSYNMMNCKTMPTPISASIKLQGDDNSGEVDAKSYRSLIGKLMYITHSRPDITYSVHLLSRFMNKPTKLHFSAGKRILRYLAGTLNYGIWYKRTDSLNLEGFSDSDWGGCLEDRKSTTGVVFSLGSGAISWLSKKQEVIALSSTEAEYIALCAAICQGIWLSRVLGDCGVKLANPFVMWCDNKACIQIANNPVQHGRTKHIDVKVPLYQRHGSKRNR